VKIGRQVSGESGRLSYALSPVKIDKAQDGENMLVNRLVDRRRRGLGLNIQYIIAYLPDSDAAKQSRS
jgi:hypothetical protein